MSIEGTIEHFGYSTKEMAREIEKLQARVAELDDEIACVSNNLDELHRVELKANPRWVELRTLKSGAVCDGRCGGVEYQICGTCKADKSWSIKITDLEAEIARLKRDHVYATGTACVPVPVLPVTFGKDTP